MATGTLNLVIDKGATYRKRIKWSDSKKQPVPLTGYAGRMHVREDIDNETVLIELTSGNGGVVLEANGDEGCIDLYIGAQATAALDFAVGTYDLEIYNLTDPDDVIRLVSGSVEVTPEITRA